MAAHAKHWLVTTMLAVGGVFVASFSMACDDGDRPAASVTPVEGSGAIVAVAEDISFNVKRIEMQSGTTTSIALENRDDVPHTLTVYLGETAEGEIAADTGEIPPGDRGEAVVFFSRPGEHAYRCQIHPDRMRGALVVR